MTLAVEQTVNKIKREINKSTDGYDLDAKIIAVADILGELIGLRSQDDFDLRTKIEEASRHVKDVSLKMFQKSHRNIS
jgi:hypothetical protein